MKREKRRKFGEIEYFKFFVKCDFVFFYKYGVIDFNIKYFLN